MLIVLSRKNTTRLRDLDVVKHVLNTTNLSNDQIKLTETDQSAITCGKSYFNNTFNGTYYNFTTPHSGNFKIISNYVTIFLVFVLSITVFA